MWIGVFGDARRSRSSGAIANSFIAALEFHIGIAIKPEGDLANVSGYDPYGSSFSKHPDVEACPPLPSKGWMSKTRENHRVEVWQGENGLIPAA